MVSYKVSHIVMSKDNYEDEYEFEEAVKDTIMMLLRNQEILTVNQEEKGVVVIEHETEHQRLGFRFPYWLYPEEIALIEMDKEGEE